MRNLSIATARHRRAALGLLAALGIASSFGGCASNPATGGADFVLMSEEKEIEIGRATHPQILRQYRIYNDSELQAYVERIGNELADKSDRPNLRYVFTVLDSEEVNAFALPGGYVYITRGLLSYLNTEAELAAVLGHEIGHITARHAVRQHRSRTLLGVLGNVAGAASGIAGSTLTNVLGGALVSGYGRDMELEADELGARYLVNVGYSSDAMIGVVGILKNQELFEIERAAQEGRDPRVYHGIFATHPDADKRLREVVKAADTGANGATRSVNRGGFLEHIDGMAFGRIKAGGVVRDQEFRHGKLGIGLRFPAGWKIDDVPGRLTATSPDRNSVLVITAQPVKERLSPVDILRDKIGIKEVEEGRSVAPDGLNGFTAVAPNANSPFGKRPVRYAVIRDRDRAYVFAGVTRSAQNRTRDDGKFITTIKSLRLLDDKSARSAKPGKVRVIEANEGTTMRVLAAASPMDQYAEQQLRLLNDLYPEGEPSPGQKIKIID
ncbi:MAG: M48 family metalloprotease [Gammaproteobacteria bacterium]